MIELSLFRHFVPTHILPPAERAELARHCQLSGFERDQSLFRRGSASTMAVYLVAGEVELEDEHGTRRIAAGSEEARHALSNADHFITTAVAATAGQLLFINRAKLDYVLAWVQSGSVEVADIGAGDDQDWMGTMLQCPAMQMIPPANIARVLARVEPQSAPAGSTIIRQGAAGDSYYVLTAGRCAVLRGEGDDPEPNHITTLLPGAGFGEEALLSGEPRNATVQAIDDCRMVRLGASDFCALLKAPLLRRVALEAAPSHAQYIDVRLPEEYAHGHLPGAINLPLRELREACKMLDHHRPLVVYCGGGRRSAAATFLLCERGYDASWVADGVQPERMTEQGTAAA
jgi:CRP-like cAMP-binding protein